MEKWGMFEFNTPYVGEIIEKINDVVFAMVFSITHRCVNLIRASCYSI